MLIREASCAGSLESLIVPNQILVAVVAKLKVYGFRGGEGMIAELLRVLENDGATDLVSCTV